MDAKRRLRGSGSLRVVKGKWYGRWYAGDRQVERSLGPARKPGSREGMTEAQAQAELQRRMGNENPAPVNGSVSVEHAGAAFVRRLVNLERSPGTIEAVEGHLRLHIVPHFKRTTLDKLTRDDVEALIAALRRKGLSAKTIRNNVSTLHSVMDLGKRNGWASENPVVFVDLPKAKSYDEIRHWSMDEITTAIREGLRPEVAPNQKDPELDRRMRELERPLYLMAATTGMRLGELIAVRWRDIDWINSRVHVVENYTRKTTKAPKANKGRSIPLRRDLLTELERHSQRSAYQGDDDRVFAHPFTGEAIDRHVIRRRWQRACKRAGVRVGRFHDFRHTFGVHMASVGAPGVALQRWGGWEDSKTAQRYLDWVGGRDEDENAWTERAFGTIDLGRAVAA